MSQLIKFIHKQHTKTHLQEKNLILTLLLYTPWTYINVFHLWTRVIRISLIYTGAFERLLYGIFTQLKSLKKQFKLKL